MTVSLKQMAESIEQIRLAMQRVEVGLHRHWMSPYWKEQAGNFSFKVIILQAFSPIILVQRYRYLIRVQNL